jgi:hemoglobin
MTRPEHDLLQEQRRANLWEEVGGDETFRALVESFYRRVEADPLLRPIFPPRLESGKEKQFLFLAQYFGAPPRYNDLHGHPRLRLRHFPFAITPQARDRWLAHMLEAVDEVGIQDPWRQIMRDYFEKASQAMVNQP